MIRDLKPPQKYKTGRHTVKEKAFLSELYHRKQVMNDIKNDIAPVQLSLCF